jgi:hypothetical protein
MVIGIRVMLTTCFGEIKAKLNTQGVGLLSTFILAIKEKCDPLTASDFLSNAVYMTGLADQFGAVTADAANSSHKATRRGCIIYSLAQEGWRS